MKPQSRPTTAERFGHWLGGRWRAYRNRERQAISWGLGCGVPPAVATGGLWLFRLLALGGLLYVGFGLTSLLILAAVASWVLGSSESNDEFELHFPSTLDEHRQLPGYDPNFHNDTSHEMYAEDD